MHLAPGASNTTPGPSHPRPKSSPGLCVSSGTQRPFRKTDRFRASRSPGRQAHRHLCGNRSAASPPAPAFPPEPQSCGRLHGAQHISEPAKVNAGFSMYHRPRDLDRYRPSTVPNCTCRARRGHDRNEHRRLRGRKDQTASPRGFAPPKQMLRCDVVPSRNFRHDCTRLIGFRDYLALDLIAPPAPTSNPGANINAAASLRSVNYMVNHICEPIQSRRATSSGSDRTLQDGDRAPLTMISNRTRELLEPAQQQAEVVSGGGENGVNAVPISAIGMAATHPMVVLEMADNGLD